VTAGLLAMVPDAELDVLVLEAHYAYDKAFTVFVNCPLDVDLVAGAAAVAQDCLTLWREAAQEAALRTMGRAVDAIFHA
jgi:hypothetical protein